MGSGVWLGQVEDLGNITSFKLESTTNFYRWAPNGSAILTRSGTSYVVQPIDSSGATAKYTVTTGTATVEWANDSSHLSVLASGTLRILPAFETLPIAAPVATGIKSLTWSPTRNEYLAISSDGHSIFVGGVSGAPVQIVSVPGDISSAEWSPTGDRLSFVSSDSKCSVVSRTQSPAGAGESVPGGYSGCWWLPDGDHVLTSTVGTLYLASVGNLANPALVGAIQSPPKPAPAGDAFLWYDTTQYVVSFVSDLSTRISVGPGLSAWAPDGRFLAVSSNVFDFTLTPFGVATGPAGGISHGFSEDSAMLAYGVENTLRVRSIASAQISPEVIVYSDDAHSAGRVSAATWSPAKDRLVYGFRTTSTGTPKLYVIRMLGTLGSAPLQVFSETNASVFGEWQPL